MALHSVSMRTSIDVCCGGSAAPAPPAPAPQTPGKALAVAAPRVALRRASPPCLTCARGG